jgi:hypothetical protein
MSRSDREVVTETEVIMRSKTNRLYWHDFGKGRFFQVVHQDEDGFNVKLASRTMLKVVYIKDHDDIEGFEFIKVINGVDKQKVSLSKFNFSQLRAFLSLINEIDLKGINEKRLKIFDDQKLDAATIKSIKTLLSKNGGDKLIETLINEGFISSRDIVNTSFRKRGLEIFKNMLIQANYWKVYARQNDLKDTSEEKVWQYFFENNEWIFGYGLDYRFQQILQREASLSDNEVDGTNTVIGDYLLGDKFFTTFIELKKPSTSLFGTSKNRTNSWKLSNHLIESVSQILEHKASGIVKLDKQHFINGEPIAQKAYDSKVVLIIGNWNELNESSNTLEKEIKKKTFELFRQDSRNIEILTFDELFERATFIVEGKKDEQIIETQEMDDYVPF